MEQTEHNLRQQTELYGEPLGVLMRRIGGTLGLTQARLAETIGLSAPMLSQLMSGQRVKIGNPAVVSRLQSLDLLVTRVTEQGVEKAQIGIELTEIRGSTGAFNRPTSAGPATGVGGPTTGSQPTDGSVTAHALDNSMPTASNQQPAARAVVREIQDLFRAVASAEEIQQAADQIVAQSPGLAELLLAYGAGRTDDAVAHYERHR